jgi:peptidoglycan/LPS O-acetylase OafA/YrhL
MPAEKSTTETKQRFLVLDALRGYAAIVIMIYHFKAVSPLYASYLAVDFFLILSGFVLTHAYFRHEGFKFWTFAQARIARLYPLHLITLVLSLGVYVLTERYIDKSDLLLHVLMIHNIGLGPDSIEFNSPAWSISVEFWVNMAIAFALMTVLPSLQKRWARWLSLGMISFFAFAVLSISPGHLNGVQDHVVPFVNMGLLRGFGSFCLGIIVYEIYVYVLPKTGEETLDLIGKITPAAIILFSMSLFSPIKETALDFLFVPFFCFVVFLAAFERGHGVPQLGRFSYLGAISFAVYLIHRPVQQFFAHILDGVGGLPMQFILSVVTTLALAVLANRYLEIPANRFGKAALRTLGNGFKAWVDGWRKVLH